LPVDFDDDFCRKSSAKTGGFLASESLKKDLGINKLTGVRSPYTQPGFRVTPDTVSDSFF
jgi:hypothetical protein